MSEQKPDGWVAWHPISGPDLYTMSAVSDDFPRSKLMSRRFDVKEDDPETVYETALDASYWALWRKLERDGWRIRPVKLVFLDDEK